MTRLSARVLVVDDDASVCEALKAVLASEGHVVVTTQTVVEALQQVRDFDPHVAILDYHLPGPNLTVALRELLPAVRIILHTGSDPESLGAEAKTADLVIQKGSMLGFLAKFRALLGS